MRRRGFITLLGGAAIGLPLVVRAQPTHPIPKIGWLKIQGREHTPGQLKAFREGMKALGLVEGRDFVLEERYADGDEGRLPSLAAELIELGRDDHIGDQPAFDRRGLARNEKRAGDRTNGRRSCGRWHGAVTGTAGR